MLSSNHWLPGIDPVVGAFALSIWAAGALAAALVCVGVIAFRRAGQPGASGVIWRSALAVVGALLVWTAISPSIVREQVAARRVLDARASELTARVIVPGSALACLDAVNNAVVEAACERALFASPEAVAAAVAYMDARLALLADSLAVADHDRNYEPSLERLRRAIEADRFGVVAHVLTTRGCTTFDCAGLKLLRDPNRVLANLKGRTFDSMVVMHSAAWKRDGMTVPPSPLAGSPSATVPTAAVVPSPGLGASVTMAPASMAPAPTSPALAATTNASAPYSHYDASSALMPAMNITNNEQMPATEANAAETSPAQARAPVPSVRRQTTREPPPASPPLQVSPFPPPPAGNQR